jgi:hypothetical protein
MALYCWGLLRRQREQTGKTDATEAQKSDSMGITITTTRPRLTASPAARARQRLAGRALFDQAQRDGTGIRAAWGAVAIVRRAIMQPGHARRAAKIGRDR